MELKEIQQRNYKANVSRGQISEHSTVSDFIYKLAEETGEFIKAEDEEQAAGELADMALVITAIAEHHGIDLMVEMQKKMCINEYRAYVGQ